MATPITGEIASSPNGQTALEEAIAGLTGGGFVTVYRIGDDIFAQLHDAAGVAVGAAINLRGTLPVTSQMLTPDVAATDDGGFVVTYRASGSVNAVYSQKFTAAGVAVGPECHPDPDGDSGPTENRCAERWRVRYRLS